MNFDLSIITANAIVIVPIVIALVQAIKLTGFIPDHYSPLLSIGIGIIIGFLGDHDNGDLTVTILSGAIYGLMASGLYSGIVTTVKAHARLKQERAEKKNGAARNRNNH